jgi:hypothetical protein
LPSVTVTIYGVWTDKSNWIYWLFVTYNSWLQSTYHHHTQTRRVSHGSLRCLVAASTASVPIPLASQSVPVPQLLQLSTNYRNSTTTPTILNYLKNTLSILWPLSVTVTLRLAVYRQSVRIGAKPREALQMNSWDHSPYVTSSVAWERLCLLWKGLAIFATVRITHTICYSKFSCLHYIQVLCQSSRSCLLKLKLIYDLQSVGQSVLVSGAHLGPVTNFYFSLKLILLNLLQRQSIYTPRSRRKFFIGCIQTRTTHHI